MRRLISWALSPQSRAYTGSLALQGFGALLGLVVQTALARWLGVSGYGLISTVLAVSTVLAFVGTGGTNGAALRYVPHFEVEGDRPGAARFVAFSLTTTLLVSTVIALGFVAVALGTGRRITGFEAVVAGALIVVTALQVAGTDLGRLARHFTISYSAVLIVRQVIVAGCALAALVEKIHPSPLLALVFLTAGAAAGFVLQVDAIRRGFGGRALRPAAPRGEWLRASPAYLVINAFQLVLGQVDLLAVSVFLTSAAVGYYAAALRTSAVLTLPYVAVMAVIRPRFSEFASRGGRKADTMRLSLHSTMWCGLATFVLSVPMIFFPDVVLKLFGASFVAGRLPLQLLAIGQVIIAFMGPGGTLLVYMDKRKVAIVGTVISTVISAVMCGVGAVVDGIDGAAVASMLSSILIGVVTYLLTWRYTGIRISVVEAVFPFLRQKVEEEPELEPATVPPQPEVAAGAVAMAAVEESSFRSAALLLWRRKAVVIATTVLAVVVAVAYLTVAPKKYDATSSLLITPDLPLSFIQASNPSIAVEPVYMTTDVEIIKSEQIATLVRRAIGSAPPVTVEQVPFTDVVQITAEASSPDLARRAADAYANAYLDNQRRRLASALELATGVLEQHLQAVDQAVAAVSGEVAVAADNPSLTGVATELATTQQALQQEQSTLQHRLDVYRALVLEKNEESGQLVS
ncbi:MAG TPA: oligosaccharide flippase family protein, partial [Acidimicrobiales bacterium]|nr:oligosaccharide flippase family protein [Acidimicrobiales bacterium]